MLDVIYKQAQEWTLKINTKKSNIIIFSGNGQNKNKTDFKYANEIIEIANKQTYLGIEMTSSGCYAYAREIILSKKATKTVFTIKRLLSNIDTLTALETRDKLFNALVKHVLLVHSL